MRRQKFSGFWLRIAFALLLFAPLGIVPRLAAQSLAPLPTRLVMPGIAAAQPPAAQENTGAAGTAVSSTVTLDQLEADGAGE